MNTDDHQYEKMINIDILLPSPTKRPIGGYKILYEYAKRIADNNINIRFVYVLHLPFSKDSIKKKLNLKK